MKENVTTLESLRLEGFRYPLERGRRFKAKGQRGEYKTLRIEQWPDGYTEVLAWWRSGPNGDRAEFRTVAVEDIAKVLR